MIYVEADYICLVTINHFTQKNLGNAAFLIYTYDII